MKFLKRIYQSYKQRVWLLEDDGLLYQKLLTSPLEQLHYNLYSGGIILKS